MSVDATVAANVARVRDRIAQAAERAGRNPATVRLVGVTKKQAVAAIVAGVRAGLADLGESFAQEARDKRPEVDAALDEAGLRAPRWHFVGQLQRNKARLVVPRFDVVASVDRISLAEELSRRAVALERSLEIQLQVNLSGEGQKGGVAPDDAPALLAAVAELPALRVTGLMTVPAAAADPEAARPAFRALRELRDRLSASLSNGPGGDTLTELSMGMSADFEVAIEEGATSVRVGQALFGARPKARTDPKERR